LVSIGVANIDPFEVVEWDAEKRGRTFTAELTHSADREDAEQLIAQWCENNQAKLDGKTTIRPDLDTVKRSVDRH
jgi:hypothetical protein